METTQETIRSIRNQLRLAMNGVTASSMREKGLRYKLNFGVSYPEIKVIAQQHEPSTSLAHALWAADCRELKILATLLQPLQEFPMPEALRWIEEAPYPEIIELLSKHLLSRLPYAEELVNAIYTRADWPYGRAAAFLLQAERFKNRWPLATPLSEQTIAEALKTIGSDASLFERRAAVQALRFYGRQDPQQATHLLEGVNQYIKRQPERLLWKDLYNDFKFEFDN